MLAVIVPVAFLVCVFPLDAISGIVLLLTAPLIPLFMILIGSLADGLTRRQWTALSRMSAHFLDVLQGLTTLKLFNRSREQIRVIAEISDRHRDTTLGVLRVAFLSALVLEMVGTLSTAIVAVEIGLRLLYGKMAFEQAFFVLILAPEFYLPLRLLGTRFHAGIAGVTAARRVFEVLERGPRTRATRGHGDMAEDSGAMIAARPPRCPVAVSFRRRPLRLRRWPAPGAERRLVRDPARRESGVGGAERRGQEHGRAPAAGVHRADGRAHRHRDRAACRAASRPLRVKMPHLDSSLQAVGARHWLKPRYRRRSDFLGRWL